MSTSFYRWPYSCLGLFAGLELLPTKSAPVNCFKLALGPAPVDGPACSCALFGTISLNSQAKKRAVSTEIYKTRYRVLEVLSLSNGVLGV
jgi:hypothetical protein